MLFSKKNTLDCEHCYNEKNEKETKEMEKKAYLPIGSVVLLKDAKKRLMIYGRKKYVKSEGKEYDYLGCLYPQGVLDNKEVVLFNQEDIQMIYFIGFQDLEELQFRKMMHEYDESKKNENN